MRFHTVLLAAAVLVPRARIAAADPPPQPIEPEPLAPVPVRPIAPDPPPPIPSPTPVHLVPRSPPWVLFGLALTGGAAGIGVGIWAAVTANDSASVKCTIIAPLAIAAGTAGLLLALPLGTQARSPRVEVGVGSIVVNGAF